VVDGGRSPAVATAARASAASGKRMGAKPGIAKKSTSPLGGRANVIVPRFSASSGHTSPGGANRCANAGSTARG